MIFKSLFITLANFYCPYLRFSLPWLPEPNFVAIVFTSFGKLSVALAGPSMPAVFDEGRKRADNLGE